LHSPAYYRPIVTLSFMFDAQISGASPFFYHLTNVFYHAIASVLVFLFLKKLKFDEKKSFYLTLIFAVHPVLTQAVSWIPGRNDSLLTIFTLSTFIFFINYLEKRRFVDLVFSWVFFALSLFTKESALLIPFFIIFYLLLFKRQKIIFLFEVSLGWWLIGFFWLILRQNAINNVLYLSVNQMLKAIFNNYPALIQYFGKIFFPFNLSVLPTIKDTTFFFGIAAIIFFIILVFFGKVNSLSKFIFGFFWFIFFLLPNLINNKPSIFSEFLEHRLYLSLIGLLIAIASIKRIDFLFATHSGKKIIFLILIIFSLINFFHQFTFRNRLVFWENAVKTSPHSPLAQRNYAVMLYFEKKYNQALFHYQKALALNPKEPMVHNNIGVIYMNQKKLKQALDEFKKELAVNPGYDNALFNLGAVYYQLGEKDKAKEYFEKTLLVNPDCLSCYQYLAAYYQEKNNPQKSAYYLQIYQEKSK
jgi:tetratricopeptide (TPR) repeat protein